MSAPITTPAADFTCYARALMMSRGKMLGAIQQAEAYRFSSRVINTLKAAVAAGTTTDPAWAGPLVEHQTMAAGFIESLRSQSVFDAMLPVMRRVPLMTRLGVFSSTASGGTIAGEGIPVPVSKFSLSGPTLDPLHATALVVLTDALVRNSSAASQTLVASELRKAVSAATNRQFIAGVTTGAPSSVSSGTTAANIFADLGTMAAAVCISSACKPFLIIDAGTSANLSFKTDTAGQLAFPDMTPSGGSIGGVTVLVSDDLPVDDSTGGYAVMLDADSIAGDTGSIVLDSSSAAALQMDDDPSAGAQNLVSLFQSDSLALKADRWFGYELIRSSGAYLLTGVNW